MVCRGHCGPFRSSRTHKQNERKREQTKVTATRARHGPKRRGRYPRPAQSGVLLPTYRPLLRLMGGECVTQSEAKFRGVLSLWVEMNCLKCCVLRCVCVCVYHVWTTCQLWLSSLDTSLCWETTPTITLFPVFFHVNREDIKESLNSFSTGCQCSWSLFRSFGDYVERTADDCLGWYCNGISNNSIN